jgi:GH15 family glucan-1,4-alpha-glucosidase
LDRVVTPPKGTSSKSGSSKGDSAKGNAGKSGTLKSGTLKSGTLKSGSSQSDSAKGNARKSGLSKSGSAKGASSKAPQSAAAPSPFPPIADYAFLSNCHTGALVAPDGTVDWLCLPRFDAPSVFGALLDREAGEFRFGPFGINVPTARIYEPGTNTLLTTWTTPTGWAIVRDSLTLGPTRGKDLVTPHTRPPTDEDADHLFVRVAMCLEGEVEMELTCEPVFDYGRMPAKWRVSEDGHTADASWSSASDKGNSGKNKSGKDKGGKGSDQTGQTIRLQTDMAVGIEGDWVRARHALKQGEQIYCALSWAEELEAPQDLDAANEKLAATAHYWRAWLNRARLPDHRWREPIQRSALAIKGLTYIPTGATVAALTTSLPETPGGERNWDYRYTWLRDSTFTLQALHYLNLDWEAEEFMQFIADLEPNKDGGLQIMYGIDGRRDLTETTREDLSGYAGAAPVRIGNGAYDQRQNDVFGAALDSILLHTRRSERLPRRLWPIVQAQAKCATKVWRKPDQGIWEARGKPRHYVSSKLMCWVAMDRASKLAHMRGDAKLKDAWRATAEEIKGDILANGLTEDGVLRQHYETDALDASNLLAALFGFLPATDERLKTSVLAIADELTENGFVLRYRTEETDDGMSGKEGSFLICSFWLVSALAIVGKEQRARDLMERLLRVASPLGLYAEEFDTPTGRHLGNFPQAFSHLALIEAAARIILIERLAEIA